jgi:hypothetical protein
MDHLCQKICSSAKPCRSLFFHSKRMLFDQDFPAGPRSFLQTSARGRSELAGKLLLRNHDDLGGSNFGPCEHISQAYLDEFSHVPVLSPTKLARNVARPQGSVPLLYRLLRCYVAFRKHWVGRWSRNPHDL